MTEIATAAVFTFCVGLGIGLLPLYWCAKGVYTAGGRNVLIEAMVKQASKEEIANWKDRFFREAS